MSSDKTTGVTAPVGPYSPPEAIEAWLRELQAMGSGAEIQSKIDQAREWLEIQKSYMAIA